jgi:hypothetical protein
MPKTKLKRGTAVRSNRIVLPLAETLAREAWSVLNHDNDFDGEQDYNTQQRETLIRRLSAVLRAHRRKR